MNLKTLLISLCLLLACGGFAAFAHFAMDDPPVEWVDPSTGHRVIRLSHEPGSASLYFHQNAYSPDGQKLVITTPTGLSTINLKTRAIEQVVEGRVGVIVTGRRSGQVYYSKREGAETAIYATHLDAKATKRIAALPRGNVSSVNADETLMLGVYTEGDASQFGGPPSGGRTAEFGGPPSGGGAAPQGEMKGPDGKPLTFAEQKEVRPPRRHPGRGRDQSAERAGVDPSRFLQIGAAGEYGEARLPAGAERDIHAQRKVDRLSIEHARSDARLRSRGR